MYSTKNYLFENQVICRRLPQIETGTSKHFKTKVFVIFCIIQFYLIHTKVHNAFR